MAKKFQATSNSLPNGPAALKTAAPSWQRHLQVGRVPLGLSTPGSNSEPPTLTSSQGIHSSRSHFSNLATSTRASAPREAHHGES